MCSTHGLTLWNLDREFKVDGFAGRSRRSCATYSGLLRNSYRRPSAPNTRTSPTPTAGLAAGAIEVQHEKPTVAEQKYMLVQAERGRAVRDVPADQVPGRNDSRWKAPRRSSRCWTRWSKGRRPRAQGDRHRHAPPRPAQRAGQHPGQAVLADLPRVRGQPRPVAATATATSSTTSAPPATTARCSATTTSGVAGRQPVAPGGRRPGARGHGAGQAGPAGQGRRADGFPSCR